MDIIQIVDLEVFAYHGVFPEEREKGQFFSINANLFLDTRKAGMSDELKYTIDYGAVCEFMHKFMQENTYNLIETAAEQLAQALLLKFDLLETIMLEIRKPSAPINLEFNSVSVNIERGWCEAYIAFGSNMGDKEKYIDDAINSLKKLPQIKVLAVSDKYVTAPYGNVEQDDFLNGVIKIKTLLSASELLQIMQQLEDIAGRKREIHWGPRTLDLDLLFYDNDIIDNDDLTVPHPDIKNREFVLKPLMQIAPYKTHPLYHKTIADMYEELKNRENK